MKKHCILSNTLQSYALIVARASEIVTFLKIYAFI